MNKSELREKIKNLVKQVYKSKNVNLDTEKEISLDSVKFPILGQYSKLKEVIVDLFTPQFEIFISRIEWVAPRPTMFRIVLANEEYFYLIYTERTWIAKIEGKKYYLLNLGEEEQAVEAISRILSYGKTKEIDTESSSSKGSKSTSSGGEGEDSDSKTPTSPSEEKPEEE